MTWYEPDTPRTSEAGKRGNAIVVLKGLRRAVVTCLLMRGLGCGTKGLH